MEQEKSLKLLESAKAESEKRIGRLLVQMGFSLKGVNELVYAPSGELIGELDLVFQFEDFLFIIDASSKNDDTNKIIAFFQKWDNSDYMGYLCTKYGISRKKAFRLYFDLSRDSTEFHSHELRRLTEDGKFNKIAYSDDIDYFESSLGKVDKWSKNDFLNWLGYQPKIAYKRIPAIQYYIGDTPVLCFVERIPELLKTCYVHRRRGNDKGYQRTLNERRIGGIEKSILEKKGLIFPNSILINIEDNISEPIPPEDCPKVVEINFPQNYCACRVIDGQHRLLGFARLEEEKQKEYSLPVIGLQKYGQKDEVQTFIDINSNQQRIDRNLILHLKSDFKWDSGTRESREKIVVMIAEHLNKSFFRDRIYFGMANERKAQKITLSTLVSALIQNNLVQSDLESTKKDVVDVFTNLQKALPGRSTQPNSYFGTNQGIAALFRLLYLFRRNHLVGKVNVSEQLFFEDLAKVFDEETMKQLRRLYGQGGATIAAKHLLQALKDSNPRYQNVEVDLRSLRNHNN